MHDLAREVSNLKKARHCEPEDLPPRWLRWIELPRLLGTILLFPIKLMRHWPQQQPHTPAPVIMVIPGFSFSDRSTVLIRWYLRGCGYNTTEWGLGTNFGRKTIGLHNEHAVEAVARAVEQAGRPIILIGWSMGGIVARMVARERPDLVRKVICIASPFTGNPYANRIWPWYEKLSGHRLDDPVACRQIAQSKEPPPVESVAIYSRSDGIVWWKCCVEKDHPATTNIEVTAGHFNIGIKPKVLKMLSQQIADDP